MTNCRKGPQNTFPVIQVISSQEFIHGSLVWLGIDKLAKYNNTKRIVWGIPHIKNVSWGTGSKSREKEEI